MEWIDVISRVIHVGTAIVVAGGSVFLLAVLTPVVNDLDKEAGSRVSAAVLGRWRRIVHIGIALFLLSGFYNYFRAIPLHRGDGLYHGLVGTKMLLAFVLFFLASVLVGRSERFEPMRQQRQKWLRVVVALATVIVAISGYVKVRGIPDRPAAETSANDR